MKNQISLMPTIGKKLTVVPGRQCLLKGATRVLDTCAHYRLYRVQPHGETLYQLGITYARETAECFVRCDRRTATRIFFSLLRGKVTPCSMIYIVSESVECPEENVLLKI